MSVQSMACPKCGKKATEYDVGKWWCLNPSCQIKFVLQEEAPITINNSSILNVNGNSLYDLNSACKIIHKPYYKEIKMATSISSVGFGIALLGSIIFLTGLCIEPNGYNMILCIMGFVISLCGSIILNIDSSHSESVITHINKICPYCNHETRFMDEDTILDEEIMKALRDKSYIIKRQSDLGLNHCENCGQQFFVKETESWGIVGKKKVLPPPIPLTKDINFNCMYCGNGIIIDQVASGKFASCPHCKKIIKIP